MSTSNSQKRKVVEILSDDSSDDQQPKKRFKPSKTQCVTITQHFNTDISLPDLEKDENDIIQRKDNTETETEHDNQNENNVSNSISNTDTDTDIPVLNQRLLSLPNPPAKTFPFELDDFQFEAIKSLETEHINLLITAHTSAGKTVIAEYAIAKALQNNQRVIYTSPIKALSNQKYREFTEKFGHTNIGLITGDVTKRKNASILVMTTEILRNMLYKGGSNLREVAYVIFDEVHYMRDVERGVVWEESIILLNKKITLIFLSATLSNSDDFSVWVSDLKDRECRVIGTETRPILLEHYILPQGGNGLYLVSTSQNTNRFLDYNFEKAVNDKSNTKTYKQMDIERQRNKLKVNELQLLLYMLHEREWCPAIVFAFSKREVESHALDLNDTINFCTKQESDMIEDVFNNAIDSLSEKDKNLPAVRSLLPLLKKGIGVHHGGILPILKEVTEILFQEGMIKVLFATETFAMGVNMPAKCVIFAAIQKFDGHSFRTLTSSEYIQMSGRAGRRGIDDKGVVILMMEGGNNAMTKEECKHLMSGKAGALTSSFRLTYNMLLNISKNIRESKEETSEIMIENDGFSYKTIIDKSFYRFLMTQRIPQIEGRIKELREIINEMENKSDFEDMKIYFDLYELRLKILSKAQNIMCNIYIIDKYLVFGRVVFIAEWGWGIVFGYKKRYQPSTYFIDVLIPAQTNENGDILPIKDDNIDLERVIDFEKIESKDKYGLMIVRFDLRFITKVSSLRINESKLPRKVQSDRDYYEIYNRLLAYQTQPIPVLDMFKDLNILSLYRDSNKIGLKQEFEERLPKLNERMKETDYFKDKFEVAKEEKSESKQSLNESERNKKETVLYRLYKQYCESEKEYKKLTRKIGEYHIGEFQEELTCKCRVLKKLKYLNSENILTPKGICASYLETNHEMLITELMFDSFFSKLSAEEICAVISTFILDKPPKKQQSIKKNKVKFEVPIIIYNHFDKIVMRARQLLLIKKECGLTNECGLFDCPSVKDEDDYIAIFNADLVNPIYQWVNGEDFVNICKLTSLFEGAIIRFIKRIRDLIKNLSDAAKAIGNDTLHEKFNECMDKLQRGIVFAASLYVDDLEEEEEEGSDSEDNNGNINENEDNEKMDNDIDIDDELTESE